jgi:hypothetical protein
MLSTSAHVGSAKNKLGQYDFLDSRDGRLSGALSGGEWSSTVTVSFLPSSPTTSTPSCMTASLSLSSSDHSSSMGLRNPLRIPVPVPYQPQPGRGFHDLSDNVTLSALAGMPSPSVSPQPPSIEETMSRGQGQQNGSQSHSKTYAFFSSPFSIAPRTDGSTSTSSPPVTPTPLPAARPVEQAPETSTMAGSSRTPTRSLTAEFFGSSSSSPFKPTSSPLANTSYDPPLSPKSAAVFQSSIVTPNVEQKPPASARTFLHLDFDRPPNSYNSNGDSQAASIYDSPLVASPMNSLSFTSLQLTSSSFPPDSDSYNQLTPRPPPKLPAHHLLRPALSSKPTLPPQLEVTAPAPTPAAPCASASDVCGKEEDAELVQVSSEKPLTISYENGSSYLGGSDSELGGNPEDMIAPGAIIRSMLPASKSSNSPLPQLPVLSPNATVVPTIQPQPQVSGLPTSSEPPPSSYTPISSPTFANSVPVTLRLTKPLGQGAFSSVWLAQDLSPTPLLLNSKRSLRDLKRKETLSSSSSHSAGSSEASSSHRLRGGGGGRNTGSEQRSGSGTGPGWLKSSASSSNLMRRLRGSISGTRPGGGAAAPQRSDSSSGHLSLSSARSVGSAPSISSSSASESGMQDSDDSDDDGGNNTPPSDESQNQNQDGLLKPGPGGGGGGLSRRVPSTSSFKSIYLDERDGEGGSGGGGSYAYNPYAVSSSSQKSQTHSRSGSNTSSGNVLSFGRVPGAGGSGSGTNALTTTNMNNGTTNGTGTSGGGGGAEGLSRASSVSWKSSMSDENDKELANQSLSPTTPSFSINNLKRTRSSRNRLVAVKLTLRGAVEGMRTILLTLILVLTAVCVGAGTSGRDSRGRKLSVEERREMDRTRVSFVREVEILKVSWAGFFFLCSRLLSAFTQYFF